MSVRQKGPQSRRAEIVSTLPLLTRKEVNSLSNGAAVYITWSGGNGPHLYRVVWSLGGVLCADNIYNGPVTFVSKESLHTHVWKVS